ncbi:alpha/beta fold hydrolase [Nocardioides albus]|uniref:Pimeloyl-ACP methyl ester carboxylesterase n=1 Tax=Nocardioides albus TaxID=1841 RepID=A0A7W5F9M1_9ACTN|nr:alpha/beta hydrolase [Nocardioides albus]MBB3090338.1 pimeloyl-ACP methyl ester carboxylesterase [Nocardioides albus]GGU29411.1 alpha/beta hydrolase [Nocardioides albus]
MTKTTISADGSTIAYDVAGTGPALVLVDGAMCYRGFGPSQELADALSDRFTVYRYDRRGRGESTIAKPAAVGTMEAVEQEVADLGAVIEAAGGHAHLLGLSSGAFLALEGARAGLPIDKIVAYEAPLILDDTHRPNDADLAQQVEELIEKGKRAAAIERFMRVVGMPWIAIKIMRLTPAFKKLTPVAHTLTYDLGMCVPFQQGRPLPKGYYKDVSVPVLSGAGSKSPAYMTNAQQAIAKAVPDGRYVVLDGQDHMVKAAALAPVATEFLSA